jgi:hypothetical protein
MSGFHVSVPHTMSREAALARVQRLLDEVRENYAAHLTDVRGQWSENRLEFGFSATGLSVQGTLVVEEQIVLVSGRLPLAALFFRGKIEQTIRQELERLLE